MSAKILNSFKWAKKCFVVLIIIQWCLTTFLIAQPNYPFCVQTNSTIEGEQDSPEIAVNSQGTVLVMFESTLVGDIDENILAVSYDRETFKEFYHSGKKSDTATLEAFPDSDKFLVSWEHNTEIYFAIVSCKNNSEEFIVAPKPIRDDVTIKGQRPDVSISRDGSLFVIGWERYDQHDVLMQFFHSTGTPLGEVVGVSGELKTRAQIGFKFWPDSTLAVCWQTTKWTGDKFDTDIWFQIFDCRPVWDGSDAVAFFASEQRANGADSSAVYVEYIQEYPEVDVFDDGRFAVMWQDFPYTDNGNGSDGDFKGAFFRIFDRNGAPQTGDIQISEHTRSFQKDADMRIRQSDSTIHIIYEDAYESTVEQNWLAYPSYRVFDDQGQALGASIELSDKSYGTDCRIAITEASAPSPNLVLWVWETKDIENYDGSGRAVIFRDSSTIVSDIEPLAASGPLFPERLKLFPNYPNPFNSSTTFSFYLPKTTSMTFSIYNTTGQLITILQDGYTPAGYHSINWDTKDLSSGVYFYSISTEQYQASGKCLLIK
jgi:hypothetical protein